MTRHEKLVVACAYAALMVYAIWVVSIRTDVPADAEQQLTVCQEDEACWDCNTMGNKLCGTTVTGTTIGN